LKHLEYIDILTFERLSLH